MLAVPGSLVIGNGTGGTNSAVVQLLASNQISSTASVTVTSSGLLALSEPDEIGLNFVGGGTNGTPALLGAAELAGAYPASNWNNGTTLSKTTGLALNDVTGTATAASASWTDPANLWSTSITDAGGNSRLMKGYLDTSASSTSTITISGLPAAFTSAGYSVYVYFDGDNGGANRVGEYTLGGTTLYGLDPANTNFSGTFTQVPSSSTTDQGAATPAGNYLVFSGLNATGFTLTAQGASASDGAKRAPVNGIEIVANAPVRGLLRRRSARSPAAAMSRWVTAT